MITEFHRIRSQIERGRIGVLALFMTAALLLGCGVSPSAAQEIAGDSREYGVEYLVVISADNRADVTLSITQPRRNLRRVTLKLDGDQYTDIRTDTGEITRNGNDVIWTVPADGGQLRWRAALNRVRADGSHDALRRPNWALFRTEDMIPPIATATRVGADAITTLRFKLPDGWSIETAYPGDDGSFRIEDDDRRFDHPDGWVIAGDIGVRYDLVSNTTVAVAAPRGQNARRLDAMAFIQWHLPYLRSLLPDFPSRLLIVMAGDPFFRGGLSAPNSLFLHTDRPLISGNGTSTLIHELMHVGVRRPVVNGEDWIVEGLAEYYSVALMHRAGTVTSRRNRSTMRSLTEWSQDAMTLKGSRSSGATTALAVTVFAALDEEIRRRSGNLHSLDDVLRRLVANRGKSMSLEELRDASEAVIGAPARTLRSTALRGYGDTARTASPKAASE